MTAPKNKQPVATGFAFTDTRKASDGKETVRTIMVIGIARRVSTGVDDVIFHYKGREDWMSLDKLTFLDLFTRAPELDVKDRVFKIRDKATGKYRGTGGKLSKRPKVWGSIGFVKSHINVTVVDPAKYKRSERTKCFPVVGSPEYSRIMEKVVSDFVRNYDVIEMSGYAERVMCPTEYLPADMVEFYLATKIANLE